MRDVTWHYEAPLLIPYYGHCVSSLEDVDVPCPNANPLPPHILLSECCFLFVLEQMRFYLSSILFLHKVNTMLLRSIQSVASGCVLMK